MVQVISVIFTFYTHGTGISAGIISALYRDYICSVLQLEVSLSFSVAQKDHFFFNSRHLSLL